ncbi:hypothetical protein CRUP_019951 [Coryphaenoides rupestris]|nr:hypothetical protein CRUP_019951 [Coryphaenoides rupestris]
MATLSPFKVTVKEGSDVELTCNTSGVPSPELIWNMSLLATNYEILTSGQMSILRMSNLSSLDHNSKISCTAENIVGEKESALLLDILWNPEPVLQWLLNGEAVTEGVYIMTRIHDVSEREYHGCLQLDSPTHLNNGQYTLLATNRYGTDRKDVDAHFMKEPWEGGYRGSNGRLWVLSSVNTGRLWVLSSVNTGRLWVLSSVNTGRLWVLSSVNTGRLWVL